MNIDALNPLPWQEELWRDLTAQIADGRMAHALLLAGARGVGKRHFAIALCAYVLCESRGKTACGTCRSCRQLAVGAHPNASLVTLDGHLGLATTADGHSPQALLHWEPKKESKRQDVTIDAARSMIENLALTSHYGQAKVALIDPADELNSASVNALLKTIEEPHPNTYLLLVTERPQGLPATLRSRCQRLRFSAPPHKQSLEFLAGVSGAARRWPRPTVRRCWPRSGRRTARSKCAANGRTCGARSRSASVTRSARRRRSRRKRSACSSTGCCAGSARSCARQAAAARRSPMRRRCRR
jgi:DNA polymerase III delta' subunit